MDKDSVDIYITHTDREKLSKYACYLDSFQYDKSDIPKETEWGKIEIPGGPTIRFHVKGG